VVLDGILKVTCLKKKVAHGDKTKDILRVEVDALFEKLS